MDYRTHYASPLGWITLAADGEALVGLWFDGQRHFGAGLSAEAVERPLPVFDEAARWLDIYFTGRDPGFAPRCAPRDTAFDAASRWLDIYFTGRDPGFLPKLAPRGTAFQRAVWAALLTIPYGRTATYGEIARAVAAAGFPRASARAVGGAVGRNPISLIIPCHRVVAADGSLTGYAGGLDRKRALLELESADRP